MPVRSTVAEVFLRPRAEPDGSARGSQRHRARAAPPGTRRRRRARSAGSGGRAARRRRRRARAAGRPACRSRRCRRRSCRASARRSRTGDSGVAWPSTFMTIATSPPPIESIERLRARPWRRRCRACLPRLVAVHRLHRRRRVEQDRRRCAPSRSTAPSVGSSAANSTSPRISRMSSSDSSRLSCFHSAFGVLLLEHALPQLRERHLEAAPPHLDDVGADREHRRADREVRAQRRAAMRPEAGSSQEASRAEDLQHELVERDRGVGAEERHRVLRAVRLELLAVLLVLAPRRPRAATSTP